MADARNYTNGETVNVPRELNGTRPGLREPADAAFCRRP
jgi:hypothetical protein